MTRVAAVALVAGLTLAACQVPGPRPTPSPSPGGQAICAQGRYKHLPGDFPEFGPPQTLYVGTTPDGIGSVFRVLAPAPNVTLFYMDGAGQLNYVFELQGNATDPGHLLWREQSDYNCRGTMDVKTDPADFNFTLYSAEPSNEAYALPSSSP